MASKVYTVIAGALLAPVLMAPAGSPTASGQSARAEHGSSETLVDARGDVYRYKDGQPRRIPRSHHADVDRVRVTHDHEAVVVRTKLFRLRREGFVSVWIHLHTDELEGRYVTLSAAKGYWRGTVDVRAGFHGIHCDSTHRIDYVTDVMTVRIARSCFRDPRWIQAHVFARFKYHGPDWAAVLLDNAHTDGGAYRVGWTPRLYRAGP